MQKKLSYYIKLERLNFEYLKSWERLCCLAIICGGTIFITLTIIAMFFYPGGYSFSSNYFSDLGMQRSIINNELNPVSRVLFLLACVLVGASLIPFWIVTTSLFSDTLITKFISYIGSAFGIASSIFLMFVGIFATDMAFIPHIISAGLFFVFIAVAMMIYSIAIFLNKIYPKSFVYVGIIFPICIIIYLVKGFFFIEQLAQKIIVYGYILWAVLLIFKTWKMNNLKLKQV